ncbi:MAG: 2-phospho-L-lactate transferase [Ilumatobacteraceae bacterium]|nr:2-phospho-L-lactate transferase [Ilumatobacteraceae bacterium]
MSGTRVTVLAGGVGAARFLRGLVTVVAPRDVTAVVNTGDDTDLHGLRVCPDLDTCTYTLAGAIDPERGWGLVGETWAALGALERYAAVRPDGSTAAPTWFGLGDRDLATHLYRTARLGEGATLTEVTAEIARAWELEVELLPMTDDRLRTVVTVSGHGPIPFQDYFVRLRHDVPVEHVEFVSDGARPTPAATAAIEASDVVVVAPSNPIVSIGPIRSLPGIDEVLAGRRESVVAVSPIVGGTALKGPADRMLRELGHDPSVEGVARLYREIAATLVVDRVDAGSVAAVEAAGMRCVVTETVMSEPAIAAALARTVLDAGR